MDELMRALKREQVLNEELAAANEELASSNEELSATIEELQRTQDNLAELNAKLEHKVTERTGEIEAVKLRLSRMINIAPIGITLLRGIDMIIEMANQPILDIWCRTPEQVMEKKLIDVFPELADQPFPAMLEKVFRTGVPLTVPEIEVDIATATGMLHYYINFSYDPLFDAEGNVEAILTTVSDITELVLARKKLEHSEEEQQALNEELSATNEELAHSLARLEAGDARFRFLIEGAPVAIAVLAGPELIVESANEMILQIWGKSRDVVGLRLEQALPELEGQPFLGILDQVFTSGEPYYGNEAFVQLEHDGALSDAYINFIYKPIAGPSGITEAIMVVAVDVTEQVRSKQDIQASEKRFRFMLNAIPQQVWTAQPGGDLDYVNLVVSEDFGYSAEEIVGQGWQAFIHPDDLPVCLERWVSALESGEEYMVEFRLKFRDGHYYWHLARALPFKEDGQIRLWLGTNTNIEVQKENEMRKDEFLSIASHELKTPLTTIKALTQLMLRDGGTDKMPVFLQKSADQVQKLEKLIGDLLDVTRINAGKMTFNMTPFSFTEMLRSNIDTMRNISGTHRIELDLCKDVTYTGDRFRLEQVIQNFVSNAIKYSPKADKIIVSCKADHGNIIVSVQDFGIGIARENMNKLFDRYYRVDNTGMRFEGLGLGLYISSEILKRHRGSFWIESEEGEGSVFSFRLPLDRDKPTNPVLRTSTFYQDSHIMINYNKSFSGLEVNWTGFQDMETVKKGGMLMLEMLKHNQCQRVVNDNREVLGTWSEAADWAGDEWLPMMEAAGLKYFAWVFSDSAFSQMSAKKSVDQRSGNVTIRFFTDMGEAEDWITGV